jgi:GNAT superfamily N-acetyltransferase
LISKPRVSELCEAGLPLIGRHCVARVMINDVVAASGRMAVAGTDAVADRVETDPAYRRRGLGRAVMDALVAGAVEMGATRGVLGASSDGRALYRTLGRTAVTDLAIARSL